MTALPICSERLLITSLGLHDVLLGRGTGPNGNPGNARLRHILRSVIRDADSLPMSAEAKNQLSVEIFRKISSAGGRFVRKLSKGEAKLIRGEQRWTEKSSTIFQVVNASVAIEKIKHSFRHQLQYVPVPSKNLFKTKSSKCMPLPTVDKKIHKDNACAPQSVFRDSRSTFPITTSGMVLQSRSQIRIDDLLRSHLRVTAAKRRLLETLLLEQLLLDSIATTNVCASPQPHS